MKSGFLETIGKVIIGDFLHFSGKEDGCRVHGETWIYMVVRERFERLCLCQEFQFRSQQSDLPSLGGLPCLSLSYVGCRNSCESLGMQQKIVMIFLVKRDVGDFLVIKMHIEMYDNNVCTNILNGYLCHLCHMTLSVSSL